MTRVLEYLEGALQKTFGGMQHPIGERLYAEGQVQRPLIEVHDEKWTVEPRVTA